jgi:hypothetical protein
MLLKTNWELEEQIENIINNHWKLCADTMEPYGTNWEHQILQKNKKSSPPHPPKFIFKKGKKLGF